MTEPTGSHAEASLADARRLAANVEARAVERLIAWLVAMAVASAFYLTGIGVAGDGWVGVTVLSAVLGTAVVSATAVFLARDVVADRVHLRRWRRTVLAWMLVLGAALGVGLPLFPGQLWFWIPAAAASVVPLVVGVALERRA